MSIKALTYLLTLTPPVWVPLGRYPWNFTWTSTDDHRTKCRRNIAETFNRQSRVHERYRQTVRQTTDRRTGDDI